MPRPLWPLLSLLLLAANAHAAPPATIAIAEIKPGMTGYGLTVFEGTKPDRFAIKVVGVLHNFLPRQDIILIRSDDPRLIHSGIVAGMSGSPVFIEGRLAGALAYGWHFAKDPIAGVTPIANMKSELLRPLRGKNHTPVAAASLFKPRESLDAVLAEQAGGLRPILPTLPPAGSSSTLVRASVPLSVAGLGAAAFDDLARALAPYHVTPLASGGAAKGDKTVDHFENGGAIGVTLVRGDVSASGTGTVTLVDGKDVLAFGHPMFNVGEVYLPITTAEIHTFMASLSSSFKFSTPLNEIGSLVQDRQSCIVGDTAQRVDMIPVKVHIGGPGRGERLFVADVARHRFLTPMLAGMVVANAAQEAASDVSDATITIRTALDVRGYPQLALTDHTFAADGLSQKTFTSSAGIKAIGEILFNQFAPANLDKIDVTVDVDYRPDVAEITGLALHTDEIEPGTRPALVVTLRPYNGAEYSESIPLDIPPSLAGATLKIEAAAGNLVKPDIAPPENLRGMLENLKKSYPARSIVVTVQRPEEGLILRGVVVPELPPSWTDTLRPGASSRKGETYKLTSRQVVPTRGVMLGKRELTVKVKDNSR